MNEPKRNRTDDLLDFRDALQHFEDKAQLVDVFLTSIINGDYCSDQLAESADSLRRSNDEIMYQNTATTFADCLLKIEQTEDELTQLINKMRGLQ